MGLPGAWRYHLFPLRRRPSLPRLVSGEHSAPIRPGNQARHGRGAGHAGYSRPVHLSSLPQEYRPKLGLMHVRRSDYRPYDPTMPLLAVRPTNPVRAGGRRASTLGPQPAHLEQILGAHDVPAATVPDDAFAPPSYDSCPMTRELFHQQMQEALGGMIPQGSYGDPAWPGYGMPGTYDEQLLRLMDPYARPGTYDPRLPGPMPDLGPGGGP
jgi:hypothetical protein